MSSRRGVRWLLAWLASSALWCAAGCEEQRPALPPWPAPEPPAADPSEPRAEPSLWRDRVEGIEASTSRFDSVDACIEELQAETPVPVVEGLDDLGYDGFFDQLCRSMRAVRDGNVEACDDLAVSTARDGCRRRLAIVHGRAEACPRSRPRDGRDPSCLAWASRDPSLCAGASEADRPACRAVFEGEDQCRRQPPSLRARCVALVQRFGAVVEAREPSEAGARPRSFDLEARRVGQDPIRFEGEFVERGVTLSPEGCRWRVEMIDPLSAGLGVGADRVQAGLTLSVPSEAGAGHTLPLDASSAVLTLVLPELGGLTSISGASGEVVLEAFEPERGGAIRGRVRGRLRSGGELVQVEGRFRSFVRDLEPLPSGCGG